MKGSSAHGLSGFQRLRLLWNQEPDLNVCNRIDTVKGTAKTGVVKPGERLYILTSKLELYL